MAFTLTFTPCQEGLYDLPSTGVAVLPEPNGPGEVLHVFIFGLVLVMDAAISSYNKKQQSNLELMQRMIDNNNVVDR